MGFVCHATFLIARQICRIDLRQPYAYPIKMALTPHQKRVLDFIGKYSLKHGVSPTQSEIARKFEFKSLGTVQKYICQLQTAGRITKEKNGRRGIEICPQPTDGAVSASLPLLGEVAAGRPIESVTSPEMMDVPQALIRGGKNFVLRVVGHSMIDDGILDGDYLIVRQQENAATGQTVVALVDNGATVKRFYRDKNRIELRAANPAYAPIYVEAHQEFAIQGVVQGVIRKLI